MLIDINAIRAAHPLPGIVAATVKLQRAGFEFNACCPFHPDKSPSFTIYDNGRRFQCFGCGVSGDVLDYIGRLHGVGLREAADMLTGGQLPSVHVVPAPPADDADRIAEAKAIWRSAQPIAGTLAETYLRSRAITMYIPDSIRFTRLKIAKKRSNGQRTRKSAPQSSLVMKIDVALVQPEFA